MLCINAVGLSVVGVHLKAVVVEGEVAFVLGVVEVVVWLHL